MGANVGEWTDIFNQRFSRYAMAIFHENSHPIHNHYQNLPSGRLCSLKARSAREKNSFIRHFINNINAVITGRR